VRPTQPSFSGWEEARMLGTWDGVWGPIPNTLKTGSGGASPGGWLSKTGMVVRGSGGGCGAQRAGSESRKRGQQREPAGGGWFPGTVELVGGIETQLDWARCRTERKETGTPRQDSRREGSHLGERPGAPGRAKMGLGPLVALGRTEELGAASWRGRLAGGTGLLGPCRREPVKTRSRRLLSGATSRMSPRRGGANGDATEAEEPTRRKTPYFRHFKTTEERQFCRSVVDEMVVFFWSF